MLVSLACLKLSPTRMSSAPTFLRFAPPGSRRWWLLVCLTAWLGSGALVRAVVRLEPWRDLFVGVAWAHGEADAAEPRLVQVQAVRIDLHAPGLEFFSTPSNGERPLETTSETTAEFLQRHRLQLAINANFYSPCCTPGDKDLRGLAISRGVQVSPPLASGRGTPVLVIDRANRAAILPALKSDEVARYWTGVAGSHLLLERGQPIALPAEPLVTALHPRTAVGVSEDGRWLFLLVIDGRQPGYSAGATLVETAAWLQRLGAWSGLNLDGGGSTTLVREVAGQPVTLNRVSGSEKPAGDGTEDRVAVRKPRSVGNNFGLWARALARS